MYIKCLSTEYFCSSTYLVDSNISLRRHVEIFLCPARRVVIWKWKAIYQIYRLTTAGYVLLCPQKSPKVNGRRIVISETAVSVWRTPSPRVRTGECFIFCTTPPHKRVPALLCLGNRYHVNWVLVNYNLMSPFLTQVPIVPQ